MTRNKTLKSLSLATGAALSLGLASSNVLADTANPFGMTDLSQGYQVAMSNGSEAEGKCGEAKCGGSKPKSSEGKCGEAKCGGSKPAEGKCGASKPAEGKCGEGKCGSK